MPITIQYQPSAQSVGNASYAYGNEQLRRYQEQQAVVQQEMAQRERMQQAGFANQQYMQGQQLDYNSRAAALGVYANQATQQRSFDQQSAMQDQSLQSAAALQDQRLQYGYQQQQDQLAANRALQEQRLSAGFAQQYLEGGQRAALQQQSFQNNAALAQQKLDFGMYALDAQQQAEVNKIQQNRSRLEAMKANGEINDYQYQQADAQIKSRELGLSRQLVPQKNVSLLDQANQSIIQHPSTGQWLQFDQNTGLFKELDMKKQQQGQITQLDQMKHDQTQEANYMKYAIDLMKSSIDPDTGNPSMTYQQAYAAVTGRGVASAGGTSQGAPAGIGISQYSGPPAPQQKKTFIVRGPNGFPENPNQAKYADVPTLKSDAEVDALGPGRYYKAFGDNNTLYKTAGEYRGSKGSQGQMGRLGDQAVGMQGVPSIPRNSIPSSMLGLEGYHHEPLVPNLGYTERPKPTSWGQYWGGLGEYVGRVTGGAEKDAITNPPQMNLKSK